MEKEISDIAIIGCGPAGLSAAINASIRRKTVDLFGGDLCAPKLQKSSIVNNYLGYPNISGETLREKFLGHAKEMNISIQQNIINSVMQNSYGSFTLRAGDRDYNARAVIIATGITVDKLIDGEREFTGKGVGYCATCDGPLFAGKDVAVIAYTGEGVEDANFLMEFCRRVYFIAGDKKVFNGLKDGIEVIEAENIQAVTGASSATGLRIDGRELAVQGVFIYRETYLPDTLLPGLAVKENHILVDRELKTNIEGVFAAGDCTGKPYQLAKAVGEGQVAALNVLSFLNSAARVQ
ncbi:MAG: NAD(P)/FAD-dependent oxidoreductase [Desulfotomaculaceae bacterium]|nr:NAD(P)/FAD-dependent oxidoreductase [Desulfotomaculaceae bacterium]